MNHRLRAGLVPALALSLATIAAAGSPQQSLTVEFTAPTSVNGTQVPAGKYKLTWTRGASEVRVTISQYGKVLAEAPAKFEERATKALNDAVVSRHNPDGSNTLKEISFEGKKDVLVLVVS